jgi:acetoacetate decarboxylase
MGFVATPEEIARMRDVYSATWFTHDQLAVEFETTPEFVAEVLPPGIEPTERPLASAAVSRWQTEFGLTFDCGVISVEARRGGRTGAYLLSLLIDDDIGMVIGRELWGECKKLGTMGYFRDDPYVYGSGTRHGVKIMEIEAELGDDEGPTVAAGTAFELKGILNGDASAFEWDPAIVTVTNVKQHTSVRRGTGSLVLRGNGYDHFETIPVVSVGQATHTTGYSRYVAEPAEPAEGDPEQYLPYVIGRSWDLPHDRRTPKRFAAGAPALPTVVR